MDLKKKRDFAKCFCNMVDELGDSLNKREKRRLKLAVRMVPAVRDEAIDAFQDSLDEVSQGGKLQHLAVSMPPGMLPQVELMDFENFDWEAATEFFKEILAMVIEIIILFI